VGLVDSARSIIRAMTGSLQLRDYPSEIVRLSKDDGEATWLENSSANFSAIGGLSKHQSR